MNVPYDAVDVRQAMSPLERITADGQRPATPAFESVSSRPRRAPLEGVQRCWSHPDLDPAAYGLVPATSRPGARGDGGGGSLGLRG